MGSARGRSAGSVLAHGAQWCLMDWKDEGNRNFFLELVRVCVTVMAFCCECEVVQWSLEKCESWLQSLIQNIWETLNQEVGNTSLGFRSPEGKQRRASCETVVEWKNVQCRTEREQVGCETLIEVTAERSKPEWILIASWRGSFCLCTYRCFPLYLCKTNARTMLNGKKEKETTTNNKANNVYKEDAKHTKAIKRAFCYKYPSLKTKAEPSFCGMYRRVFCYRTEILRQEEYCTI